MTTLFIADLHLSSTHPEITDGFFYFIEQYASKADKLYVLGDLFDFWIGDDDNSPFSRSIIDAFQTLTHSGVDCYFIHGNRDFLIGNRFSQESGVTLLPQETKIDLYGTPTLILHGDTLCQDDVKYQEFRKKVHQPWLQKLFLCVPLLLRKKIVSSVQKKTRQDKQTKALNIMDVTESEVKKVMNTYQVPLMIHGHTHRPFEHTVDLDNAKGKRVVLGDWYRNGYALAFDETGEKLITFPLNSTKKKRHRNIR
jgi:UDP-2,3-diacylglucosamine hydrolase